MQVIETYAEPRDFSQATQKFLASPTSVADKQLGKKRSIVNSMGSSNDDSVLDKVCHGNGNEVQIASGHAICANKSADANASPDQLVSGECSFFPSLHVAYAGLSQAGINPAAQGKPNQDRIICFADPPSQSLVVACLDGHGLHGHKVAQFFKEELQARLCRHPLFVTDVERALREVLLEVEYALYLQDTRLADYSGTTLSLLVLRNDVATVCNIGDSRVVLGRRDFEGGEREEDGGARGGTGARKRCRLEVQEVTLDHKPDHPDEHQRIISAGGRVFAVRYSDSSVGPPRVWLGGLNVPGLAMSRSLGDFVVHTAGVVSTPDFFTIDLRRLGGSSKSDMVVLVGTDGVWDFVSSEQAVKFSLGLSSVAAGPMSRVERAVRGLVEEARGRWMVRERMVDDTSLCMLLLSPKRRECALVMAGESSLSGSARSSSETLFSSTGSEEHFFASSASPPSSLSFHLPAAHSPASEMSSDEGGEINI